MLSLSSFRIILSAFEGRCIIYSCVCGAFLLVTAIINSLLMAIVEAVAFSSLLQGGGVIDFYQQFSTPGRQYQSPRGNFALEFLLLYSAGDLDDQLVVVCCLPVRCDRDFRYICFRIPMVIIPNLPYLRSQEFF